MSFYNMVFGMNAQLALVVSCVLGFRVDKMIPRFRNVFLEADDCPFAEYDFLIYTRMGGGNYECWGSDNDPCDCPYCKLKKLEQSEWHIGGYDDDFDCTYRTLVGKFTPAQKELFQKVMGQKTFEPIMSEIKTMFPEIYEKINTTKGNNQ